MKNTIKVASYTVGVFGVGVYVGQIVQSKFTAKRWKKAVPSLTNMLDNLFDLAMEEDVTKDDLRRHAAANIRVIVDSLKK